MPKDAAQCFLCVWNGNLSPSLIPNVGLYLGSGSNLSSVTMEGWVQSQASLQGICDGRSDTGMDFSLSNLVFPYQHRHARDSCFHCHDTIPKFPCCHKDISHYCDPTAQIICTIYVLHYNSSHIMFWWQIVFPDCVPSWWPYKKYTIRNLIFMCGILGICRLTWWQTNLSTCTAPWKAYIIPVTSCMMSKEYVCIFSSCISVFRKRSMSLMQVFVIVKCF